MKLFLFNWERLTSDRSILQMVHGYLVDLVGKSEPIQLREPRTYKTMHEEIKAVDDEIARFLNANVINLQTRRLANSFLTFSDDQMRMAVIE